MEDWNPEILVLGPGGIKGFLFLGALLILESEGYLERIKTFVGVSVGAIISLLLVAGYTVTEIISEAVDTSLFQDISCINLTEIKENTGLISNRSIKEKLIARIEDKFGKILSLQELYDATGLEFMCVTMNLDQDKAEYISRKTYPQMSCVDAVLLSMNIPLLFYKLKYRGCVYIDGAFANPYPIDVYDDGKRDILGMYITSSNPAHHVPVDSHLALYLYKIIDSSMTQIRERIIRSSSPRCKHLELISPTFDTTGLTVDLKLKSQMITIGYTAAKEFLDKISGKEIDVLLGKNQESLRGNSESYENEDDENQPLSPRIQRVLDVLSS
jgi:predicted acylesterase/phospholipase RssA